MEINDMKKLTDYLPPRRYGEQSKYPQASVTLHGDDIHRLRTIATRENMSQAVFVMALLNFYEKEKDQ